ncbi:MAG: glycosyl hydrolase, partial [Chthonomonadales bacterium]
EKAGPPVELKTIKFRNIGPAAGGRVARACGVPGDPLVYYAATAGGGVWKSTNGGVAWKPIFDDQPISSLGSIAVAPSDSNVIYVGSGEANIRGNVAAGNGIYKSTDAGKTWKHVWNQQGQIGTIIVHPQNPDVAYAAVLGHAFGPNAERGVYRTMDGGKSWQQVLKKDVNTGASDVCFDPSNPRILFAGLWQTRRKPWDLTSGGPGSSLYTSTDSGDTWKELGPLPKGKDSKGLPEGIWGKVGVAVAPSDSRKVYVLIEADKGGLYKSEDGGEHWSLASGAKSIRQRAFYYSTITIDPNNSNIVWCPQVSMQRSIDGGKSFQTMSGMGHGDNHDIWIDPKNPKRMINANDGGVNISTDGGESWYAPPLPIAQFYHVSADNRVPYHVSGTMQDLGTASGPSNSLSVGGIQLSDWYNVGGGETGFTAPDPVDPNIVYAGEYGGIITRYDHKTRQSRNVTVYPANPSGHGAEDMKYRFQWTAPILISPHDHNTVYHGGNIIFKTDNGGQSWKPISPDLTRNDKSKQKWAGGPITGDNTTVEFYDTVFSIAESPRRSGVLWAGSDDGLVHVSMDGGGSWTNVTSGMLGLPEWGTVCCIECSPHDAGTAYVVVEAHRLDNMKPYLWMTTDYGKTWKSLTKELANDVYLHSVREDPKDKGMLYVGTERGIEFSRDNGSTWNPLKLNLPTVAVHDLVVKGDDLVVATQGRSLWILDDLTPLRNWKPEIAKEEFHLFPTLPAVNYLQSFPSDFAAGRYAGPNPPSGAVFHYFLKTERKNKPEDEEKSKAKDGKSAKDDKSTKPKEPAPITLEVFDVKGALVRKLSTKPELMEQDDEAGGEPRNDDKIASKQGVNRIVWDMRYNGAVAIPKAKVDSGDVQTGPMALPGNYTLKLTVDGKSQMSTVELLADPRLTVPQSDLSDCLQTVLAIRDDITKLSQTVIQLKSVRKQLADFGLLIKDITKAEPLVKPAKELGEKLDNLEEKMHNPKAEVVYDILAMKGGAKLYSQLSMLYSSAMDTNAPPTQGAKDQYAELRLELNKLLAEYKELIEGDLAKLNTKAHDLELTNVIVPPVKVIKD